MPANVCRWCGMEMPEGATTCPWCHRAVSPPTPQPRPPSLGIEQAPQVPLGQEQPGSFAQLRTILVHDPLFAIVLIIIALGVFYSLSTFSIISAAIGIATLWGLLSWESWGLWLAVIVQTLGLLIQTAALIGAAIAGSLGESWVLAVSIQFGVRLFILIVLLIRRDRFA